MLIDNYGVNLNEKCLNNELDPVVGRDNEIKRLIEIFTDEGDVVIDPVAGSASTLRACKELNRSCYGFEIKKNFYKEAKEKVLSGIQKQLF